MNIEAVIRKDCPSGGMVDAGDLKSSTLGCAGSTPASGTNTRKHRKNLVFPCLCMVLLVLCCRRLCAAKAARFAQMAKSVDAADSKSATERCGGSSPSLGTKILIQERIAATRKAWQPHSY